MNAVTRVEKFLHERFRVLVDNSADIPNQDLEIRPPITEQEASYFIKGLDQNIFSINDRGYAQSQLLPIPSKNGREQRIIQIFWNHGGGVRGLFREGINQLATACRLIIEYKWDISEIKMEPSIAEFGDLAYGVDIIVLGPDGKIPLCCENKSNDNEFQKLIKQFESCCSKGEHPKKECTNPSNHPKYEFCLKAKPGYFWLVSPGIELCLELSYFDGGVIRSSKLSELPSKENILRS